MNDLDFSEKILRYLGILVCIMITMLVVIIPIMIYDELTSEDVKCEVIKNN